MTFIASHGSECNGFFQAYIPSISQCLYIGTLGFNDICLYFPTELARYENMDFLFLVEERPEVSPILKLVANRNKLLLQQLLENRKVCFESVRIVADDTANVAGRSAAKACNAAMGAYSAAFVDASSMSRGVCFPIVRQAYELARRQRINAHLLIAGRQEVRVPSTSMSNDAPHYVHGFQADMNLDSSTDALKLWIPQLSSGIGESLNRIFNTLKPDETCPILPFPSHDPRRGDKLMKEYQRPILELWDVNLRDIIYAHESDPTDVCETITRIHRSRQEAFEKATNRPPRTILSPTGSRIGSLGMLLAALRLDLPIMYEESIGYTSPLTSVPSVTDTPPDNVWHIWLRE